MQSVPLAMSQRGTDLEIPAPTNFVSSRQCDYPQHISHECTEIHLKLPFYMPDGLSLAVVPEFILEAACTSAHLVCSLLVLCIYGICPRPSLVKQRVWCGLLPLTRAQLAPGARASEERENYQIILRRLRCMGREEMSHLKRRVSVCFIWGFFT